MEAKPLAPAAQYVRMSTEDQQYSIANQEATIQEYAQTHGYVVVSIYADPGKSGVEIKHRKELRRLLADVMSGRAMPPTPKESFTATSSPPIFLLRSGATQRSSISGWRRSRARAALQTSHRLTRRQPQSTNST
jgi:hypothetical protein